MADIERSWLTNPSRRKALARLAGLMAASPIAAAVAQTDPQTPQRASPRVEPGRDADVLRLRARLLRQCALAGV